MNQLVDLTLFKTGEQPLVLQISNFSFNNFLSRVQVWACAHLPGAEASSSTHLLSPFFPTTLQQITSQRERESKPCQDFYPRFSISRQRISLTRQSTLKELSREVSLPFHQRDCNLAAPETCRPQSQAAARSSTVFRNCLWKCSSKSGTKLNLIVHTSPVHYTNWPIGSMPPFLSHKMS